MNIKLKLKKIRLKDIKPYKNNPKIHTKEQIQQIKESIQKFEYLQPIVVDKNNQIIIGHARFQALNELYGEEKIIEVVDGFHLNKEEVKKIRILDNKLNESDWDFDLLTKEIENIFGSISDNLHNIKTEFNFNDEIFLSKLEKIKVWDPPLTEDLKIRGNDGIVDLVGYNLSSFWKDIKNENSRVFKFQIELPHFRKTNIVKNKYSRTNLEEIERIILTYMRKGDYFLESCCGWGTFSSIAKFYGYSGKAIDIWDVALEHTKKQLRKIPGQGKVEVLKMDAMHLKFKDEIFSFIYCNPPFLDEEFYSGLEKEIANSKIEVWASNMERLISECYRVLKKDCLFVLTINDIRKKGELVPLHSICIDLAKKVGFYYGIS